MPRLFFTPGAPQARNDVAALVRVAAVAVFVCSLSACGSEAAGGDKKAADAAAADSGVAAGGDTGPGTNDVGAAADTASTDAGTADGGPAGNLLDTVATDASEIALAAQLCLPCHTDGDCAPALADCVSHGAAGSYCATHCSVDPGNPVGCPGGYDCRSVASVARVVATRCMPVDKSGAPVECGCSALAVQAKASTSCVTTAMVAGQEHFCTGLRACSSAGLSACDAPAPVSETCDGVDQDCDGQTDEATCAEAEGCKAFNCVAGQGCVAEFTFGPCDADGDPCTLDKCDKGACAKVGDTNCSDSNTCTSDTCTKNGACVHGPEAGPCEDGLLCTLNDSCSGGLCVAGKLKNCDDKNACTDDTCVDVVGCTHNEAANGTHCDDGDQCTAGDACKFGACQKGAPQKCDDGTDCTSDTCDQLVGCLHKPVKLAAGKLCTCTEPANVGGAGGTYAIFGAKGFSKYVQGTLPVVLSSPHGGPLKPASIPDRTYGVTGNDSNSRETTWLVARELALATGRMPHVVINRLARIKLDANREIKEAAQGNAEAEQAYKEFQASIVQASGDLKQRCGKGLYLDMHTNGHSAAWLELGYRVSAKELSGKDADLDAAAVVNKSSLRSLASWSGTKHAQLLRGPKSLGALLSAKGIKVVPSPKYPHPAGGGYFSGGYNTKQHSSALGGSVDGVQVETHFSMMNTETKRQAYAKHLAAAILVWLKEHYGIATHDKTHVAPTNEKCAKAAQIDFLAGAAEAAGTTTFASNEFGTAISCGNGFALDGPQLYFEVQLDAAKTYDVTVKADFGGRAYLFAKTCSAAAISAACAKSSLKGALLTSNIAKTTAFKPAKSGPHLLVVDSRAPQWHGAFEVAVKETKKP